MIKMNKFLALIIILYLNCAVAKNIEPLNHYSLEEIFTDEKASHTVLERCISLYSAITELIKKEHPELAKSFFEMANTLYPYGLLSLEKVEKISSNEAEKIFFKNITNLSKIYIEEMNINGKKYGSYLRGSFLGDDLSFCHEVTKSINLVILESNIE